MEWVFYFSGITSGAFLVLAVFTLVVFYKTRGFRIDLLVRNQTEESFDSVLRQRKADADLVRTALEDARSGTGDEL